MAQASDNRKSNPQGAERQARPSVAPSMPMGAYGLSNTLRTSMFGDQWKDHRKHWTERTEGKLLIRCFSRGILGAAFFAWGQIHGSNTMEKYDPSNPKGLMQRVAWVVDKCVGVPLQWSVSKIAGKEWGERLVTFRDTRTYYQGDKLRVGRTLGAEVMGITFDFGMASLGNWLGDEIAYGIFNPNVRSKWLKDGKFEAPHALKELGKAVWKGVSYRMGEDYAVAIPYAFYLRAQRSVIDHFSPGFKYDSDRALNGGSLKVAFQDVNGNLVDFKDRNRPGVTMKTIGNYQLEGALDLQGRFTAYNIGTLMYREAYNAIGKKLVDWKKDGFHMPTISLPQNPVQSVWDTLTQGARYVTKSVIKGGIIMTPAVPFFWFSRTPQSKDRGMAIYAGPDAGTKAGDLGPVVFGRDDPRGNHDWWGNLYANTHIYGSVSAAVDPRHGTHEAYFLNQIKAADGLSIDSARLAAAHSIPPASSPIPLNYDIYGKTYDKINSPNALFDKVFSPIGGELVYKVNNKIKPLAAQLGEAWVKAGGATEINKARNYAIDFSDRWLKAAAAYTPYFVSKTDIHGSKWDNKQMDMSIYRMIDGATHFNWGEFSAGLGEVKQTILRQPLKDPDRREAAYEAHRKNPSDNSPQSHLYKQESMSFLDREMKKKFREQQQASFMEMAQKGNWQAMVAPPRQHTGYAAQIDEAREGSHFHPGTTIH